MRKLQQWASAHPVKSCLYTSLFTFIATLSAARPDLFGGCAVVYLALLIMFAFGMRSDLRKMTIAIIVAVSLSIAPLRAEEQPPVEAGAVGVGVVVLIVGGVIFVGLYKLCSKVYPKTPEKKEGEDKLLGAPAPAEEAAQYQYLTGSGCYTPQDIAAIESNGSDMNPFTTKISATMDALGELKLTGVRQVKGEDLLVSYEVFESQMAAHGLSFTRYGNQKASYGKNGVPSTEDQVPIAFSRTDNSVTVGRAETFRAVIERSSDLVTWYPVVTVSLSSGQTMEVTDLALPDQMFYRAKSHQ